MIPARRLRLPANHAMKLGARQGVDVTGRSRRRAERIVLAASGSHGDVHPFIAIGLALKARGMEAVIATREAFRDKVQAEGLAFAPLRPDIGDLQARFGLDAQAVAQGISDPHRGVSFMVRHLTMGFLREGVEDMLAATEGADLVVAHSTALPAKLAAEARGLPWLSAVLQPFAFMSAYDPPVTGIAPWLDALRPIISPSGYRLAYSLLRRKAERLVAPYYAVRRELGLADSGHPLFEGQFSPHGTLALYSPLLGEAQPDFPPNTTITGFCFYDSESGGGDGLDPELERFLNDGPAPVVVTLGTAGIDGGDFFEIAGQAVRRLDMRAVFLTGGVAAPSGLGRDIAAWSYAPYSKLFPRASLIVHQAGIGTVGQALRARKPQLCVPFLVDQPDNAARVNRLGAGKVLNPAKCDARRLAAKISAAAALQVEAGRGGGVSREAGGAEDAVRMIRAALI